MHLKHKTSSVAGKAPQPADLERGELAVNLADRKLFTKDHTDVVITLGGDGVLISDTPPATPMAGSLWWKSDTGELFVRYEDANSAQWVGLGGKPGKDGEPGQLITASDTAPPTPKANDVWWKSDSGALFLYYDDGTSQQWIAISGPAGPAGKDGKDGTVIPSGATAPTTPAAGDLWVDTTAAANPVLKRYSGTAWVLVAPPAPPPVVAAATSPASPVVNALWFDTTTGKLLIYHNDGTSQQWVSLT